MRFLYLCSRFPELIFELNQIDFSVHGKSNDGHVYVGFGGGGGGCDGDTRSPTSMHTIPPFTIKEIFHV